MWFQTLKTRHSVRSFSTENSQGLVLGLEYTDRKTEIHALKVTKLSFQFKFYFSFDRYVDLCYCSSPMQTLRSETIIEKLITTTRSEFSVWYLKSWIRCKRARGGLIPLSTRSLKETR